MSNKIFPCDVCDSDDGEEIQCISKYTKGAPIHVCRNCGFVYVRERRSFQEIADTWSNEIYSDNDENRTSAIYTAIRPAIRSRLIYILETIDAELGLKGKSLCDIGAGEGVFLDYINRLKSDVYVFGIEPSKANCELMTQLDIDNFPGTIEEYIFSLNKTSEKFDVVTISWTLEDCQDCKVMLNAANNLLKPGGHLVIGTGSRILVPYKKPLDYYVGPGEQDTHCFRFSPNSLSNLMKRTGFLPVYTNRYIDQDVLCMIGQKDSAADSLAIEKDNYQEVIDYFERWDFETDRYFNEK